LAGNGQCDEFSCFLPANFMKTISQIIFQAERQSKTLESDKKNRGNAGGIYGLVVCGGRSSRMGTDKGLLVYHDRPQQYHVYEMLNTICDRVFLSCNKTQFANILPGYAALEDDAEFANIGPMAALLTAFFHHPEKDFLIVGCDYPFLKKKTLQHFVDTLSKKSLAAAFYNTDHKYEPLLAWYSLASANILKNYFNCGKYSLQQFLNEEAAEKYRPEEPTAMKSVDTYDEFQRVKLFFENLKNERKND